jgi:hypothetical protein
MGACVPGELIHDVFGWHIVGFGHLEQISQRTFLQEGSSGSVAILFAYILVCLF